MAATTKAQRRKAPPPPPAAPAVPLALQQTVVVQLASLILGAAGAGAAILVPVEGALAMLKLGLSAYVLRFLAMFAVQRAGAPLGVPPGACLDAERENASAWLALFLVHSALRMARAEAEGDVYAQMQREERYFSEHLEAEERRLRAAAMVDSARRLVSAHGLVGWRAVLDSRTTPECRAAHGKNFPADRMPVIGWPGAVHRACRCSVGPPIPGAPVLPTV